MIVWFWLNYLSFWTQNIQTPAVKPLNILYRASWICFVSSSLVSSSFLPMIPNSLGLTFSLVFFLWVTAVVPFILPQAKLSLLLILLSFADHMWGVQVLVEQKHLWSRCFTNQKSCVHKNVLWRSLLQNKYIVFWWWTTLSAAFQELWAHTCNK